LAARRAALVAQSDALRSRLLWTAADVRRSLSVFHMGGAILRGAGRNPALLVAGAAVLGVLGPRRALRVLMGGVATWKLLQRLRRLWRALHP
jgi:hypothetical protein